MRLSRRSFIAWATGALTAGAAGLGLKRQKPGRTFHNTYVEDPVTLKREPLENTLIERFASVEEAQKALQTHAKYGRSAISNGVFVESWKS